MKAYWRTSIWIKIGYKLSSFLHWKFTLNSPLASSSKSSTKFYNMSRFSTVSNSKLPFAPIIIVIQKTNFFKTNSDYYLLSAVCFILKMIVLFFAVTISMVYAASVDTNPLTLKDADRLGILFIANTSRKLFIVNFIDHLSI